MYLKSISDTSVIVCGKIISFMNIVSRKIANTIAANESINCHTRKVKYKVDCYSLHTVLLAIILLLINYIICYLFAIKMKNIGQNKRTLMH